MGNVFDIKTGRRIGEEAESRQKLEKFAGEFSVFLVDLERILVVLRKLQAEEVSGRAGKKAHEDVTWNDTILQCKHLVSYQRTELSLLMARHSGSPKLSTLTKYQDSLQAVSYPDLDSREMKIAITALDNFIKRLNHTLDEAPLRAIIN